MSMFSFREALNENTELHVFKIRGSRPSLLSKALKFSLRVLQGWAVLAISTNILSLRSYHNNLVQLPYEHMHRCHAHLITVGVPVANKIRTMPSILRDQPPSISVALVTPGSGLWSRPPIELPHSGQRASSMGIPHSPIANYSELVIGPVKACLATPGENLLGGRWHNCPSGRSVW
jgi:hypothetical protein